MSDWLVGSGLEFCQISEGELSHRAISTITDEWSNIYRQHRYDLTLYNQYME